MKVASTFVCAVFLAALGRAVAEGFRPGNVFVSDAPFKYCYMQAKYGWDRIWEIDPDTGEARVFANLMGPECGFISGLAFTPDGCRLRASQNLQNRIVEFAPDGSWTVALDFNDGIFGPEGYNNLAYDAEGNFYVVNCVGNIMKFPKDGGPGVVFADRNDGITGCGSIAFAPDGDLYWADFDILRINGKGNVELFDDLGPLGAIKSLAADFSGKLFAGFTGTVTGLPGGIYRFLAGDPTLRERLPGATPVGAMAMAPDQRRLYVFRSQPNHVLSVDTTDGSLALIAAVSANEGGLGIAVAPLTPGDFNRDGNVGSHDHQTWIGCKTGPDGSTIAAECRRADVDGDGDVDLADWAKFQSGFGAQSVCP